MAATTYRLKGLVSALGGWVFLIAVAAFYVIFGLFNPVVAAEALSTFQSLLRTILPILALVFSFLFLANAFLERKWLIRYLGRASGLSGWVLTIICGVLSAGPLYVWYPLLGELRDKGMSGTLIATFLYSRALKLPLLPLMVHYFGIAYTVLLSVCIIVFAVWSGLLMRRFGGVDVVGTREG